MYFNFLGNNNEFEFREDSWRKLLRECMEYDIDKMNALADNEFRAYQTNLRLVCLLNRIFCIVQLFFILAAAYCCYKQIMQPVVVFVVTILQYLCFWIKIESTLVDMDRAKTKYDMLCHIRDENVFKQYKITPFANSGMTFYDLGQKYEYCNNGKVTQSNVIEPKPIDTIKNKVFEIKTKLTPKEESNPKRTETKPQGRGANSNYQRPTPPPARPITNPTPRQNTETYKPKYNNKKSYDDLDEYFKNKKMETTPVVPEKIYIEKEVPKEKIVYRDRIIEKEVEKPVPIPVEKIVYRDKIVEKPVEKIVYRDRIIEKEVPKEKIVYRDKPVKKKKSIHDPKVTYKDVL